MALKNSATTSNIVIDDAHEHDFAAIQEIYSVYVINSYVSLEEEPPSIEEMKSRWQKSYKNALPYITATIDGTIAGYAYAFPYRPRSAYRFTVEESIYIAEDFKGRGIGHALLSELIKRCREKKYKQMISVIAGADNIASIKFHETFGFRQIGTLQKVGFKFGQWVDTIIMQKDLSQND